MKSSLRVNLVLAMIGYVGTLMAGTNLISNPDMSLDDGVNIPAGWSTRVFPAEFGGKISAEPLADGIFVLTVSGRNSTYWWEQSGLTLVPGARYRLSLEVRTAGLDGGNVSVYARNREWNWDSPALCAPSDTKGEWVARSCEFEAYATKAPDGYCVALSAKAGKSGVAKAEFRGLKLEAVDPAVAAASRPMPSERLKRLVARIVPVDPLLSRVDAATGKLRFYWSRASRTPGCTLSCRLDEANGRPVSATFDAKDYAAVALGKVKSGEHRIAVSVCAADGAVLASNAYRIVVGTWKDTAQIGKRLNNLVTELVNAPLKDGEVKFERAEDGWTWISFDGDIGEAKGYLDGCPDCVVFRREGEPTVESQRYLKAGEHTLRVKGAKGGRLRIHAVKVVMGGTLRGYDRAASSFEDLGSYVFGLPFLRKYGLFSCVNVLTDDYAWRMLPSPFSTAIGHCLSRGMQLGRSVLFAPQSNERLTEEGTYRHIARGIWPGFPGGLSIDENALRAPSLQSVNFSEAIWRLYDENPQNAFNVFYCDTSEGVVYNEPRQNVSEISCIVNSGDGRGLLCPECYMPVTPGRERFKEFVDANANFIASALEMVPASRGKTILYGSSYIMIGEWSNYYAPETDIKVQTADLMRAYAVDPRFSECGGIGFGGIGRGNDEYVRWSMKLVRYYALEGGTEDLAEKYGYAWNPDFVKDPDFAQGLTCWQAKPAEADSLTADKIHQYSIHYQHRVGAPGGFGDTMAKFVVSKAGPNVLSQKLTGLKPGAFYSLQFHLTDRMAPGERGDWWRLVTEMPLTLTARLEGGEEVKDLHYSHPLRQTRAVPEEDRKRSMMHFERYVFRATAPEATLVFSDWAGDALTTAPGRTYLLNYIIFAPFYCEGAEDVRDITATIKGESR